MRALITGADGQDGRLMASLLTSKGYELVLCGRKKEFINHTSQKYVSCDIRDKTALNEVFASFVPDEVYHFAGMSSPSRSFLEEETTIDVNVEGTRNVLNSMLKFAPSGKLFFASSSEVFGDSNGEKISLRSRKSPRNPYGWSKLYASELVEEFREKHGLFACIGYLFNHESELRTLPFLVPKIAFGVAGILLGIENFRDLQSSQDILHNGKLLLGNVEIKRDWSDARKFMEAIWLMLQQSNSDDYIVGSGRGITVRQLVETAFSIYGIDGKDRIVSTGQLRRDEPKEIVADVEHISRTFGWAPESTIIPWIQPIIKSAIDDLGSKIKV